MSDIDDEFLKEKDKYDLLWNEWKESNENCKKIRINISSMKKDLRSRVDNNKELRKKVKIERDKLLKIYDVRSCFKSLLD